MKAIIKRPCQRPLLVVLSLTILTGCSGVKPKAIYKSWEQKAYSAYKVAAPKNKTGMLPALFKTVSIPGMNLHNRHRVFKAKAHQSSPNVPAVRTERKNLQYIEQHYGL